MPPSSPSFSSASASMSTSRLKAADVFGNPDMSVGQRLLGGYAADDDGGNAGVADASFHTAAGSPSMPNGRFDAYAPAMQSAASVALATVQRQQQQMQMHEHIHGPAPKRRRGVAGAIIDGALNGLMIGGAAALTVYSLWSSWGRAPDHLDQPDRQSASGVRTRSDATETRPVEEAPPRPYETKSAVIPGGFPPSLPGSSDSQYQVSRSSVAPVTSAFVGKTTPSKQRRQHVYVSSRRRRPLFESAWMSYRGSPASQVASPAIPRGQDHGSFTSNPTCKAGIPPSHEGEPMEGGDEEDDEAYIRFREKMSRLIAEGQAALESKSFDVPMNDNDDELLGPTPSSSPLLSKQSMTGTESPTQSQQSSSRIPRPSRRSQGPRGSTSTPLRRFKGAGEVNLRFASTPEGSPGVSFSSQSHASEGSLGFAANLFDRPTPAMSSRSSVPFVFGSRPSVTSSSSASPFHPQSMHSRSPRLPSQIPVAVSSQPPSPFIKSKPFRSIDSAPRVSSGFPGYVSMNDVLGAPELRR